MRALFSRLDPEGLRPTFAVAGIVLGLYLGSQLLNAVIPVPGNGPGTIPGPGSGPGGPVITPNPGGPGPVQPGQSVDIGPLRITLLAGWQPATTPSGILRIGKGSVAIDIQTLSSADDPATIYNNYVNQALSPDATGFAATQSSPLQIGGMPAARGSYSGAFGGGIGQVEGELTTLQHAGTAYVFDAWGPMGTLRGLLSEVDLMLNMIQVRG